MSELVPSEPPELRLSDDEREKVAGFLRGHVGEGRLTLSELEERLEVLYSARTRGDLVPVTGDLPALTPAPVARPGPPRRSQPVDPVFRRHLLVWAVSWILWLPLLAVFGTHDLVVVPILIWTGVLFLHWLRSLGG